VEAGFEPVRIPSPLGDREWVKRGFAEEEARKFLIFGFFDGLLEKIHMEGNLENELKDSLQRFSNT